MTVEQGALLDAARKGDREACERILTENDRLIWSIVGRYTGRGVETEDLFQLGCIGFLKAIQGYDPAYGTQFSTYAVPKIAGEIRRFLRDDGAVKVSRTVKERAAKVQAARGELVKELGQEPSISQLAEKTGLTAEEIALCDQANVSVASLQAENSEGMTLESALGDDGLEERMVEWFSLREAVSTLPERERTVIILRYWRGYTQSRIARMIGVSQVQVSRMERRAVKELREKLSK